MFIRQLSYIVALAREQHFGRAAAVCNVSQPALSSAIRSIEEELGVVIVRRGRRFEGFTSAGERVLGWARRMLADCEALKQDASDALNEPTGVLRMGVIPAALPLVPRLTDDCMRTYPRMRHQIFTMSASEILRKIGDFELDVGLTYLDDSRLDVFVALSLFRERYILVAAEQAMFNGSGPVSWADASKLPLCLFTENMQCRRGMEVAFSASGVMAEPRIETDSMTTLYAHVRRASVYSILPQSVLCLVDGADQLAWRPMLPEVVRDIGLVMLPQHGPVVNAALRSFRSADLQAWVDSFCASPSEAPLQKSAT